MNKFVERDEEVKKFTEFFVGQEQIKERYVVRVYINHIYPIKSRSAPLSLQQAQSVTCTDEETLHEVKEEAPQAEED